MKFRLFSPDARRLLAAAAASLLVLLLLLANLHATLQIHSPHVSWLSLGFSIILSLLYLALGVIVWLYSIGRGVAGLACGFALSLSATFAVETTASLLDGTPFTTISRVSSGLGFMFLALLLVVFPHNWLRGASTRRQRLVRILIVGIIVAGGITVLYALFSTRGGLAHALFGNPFYALVAYASLLLCSLATILASYWRASFRERQQFLLVFLGIGLAVTPFTILTVLPMIFRLSAFIIDSQISSIPFVLMPLSICYSILRYQLIIFDRVIRVAVSRITGVVVITLVAYLVVLSTELFVHSQQELIAAIIASILTPLAWRGTHVAIEHLFFREEIRYRTLVGERAHHLLRLSEVCDLLLWKARETLGTSFVCLFVYESTRGEYVIPLPLLEQPRNHPYFTEVVGQLQTSLNRSAESPLSTFSLAHDHPLVSALTATVRPISVRDALARDHAPSWKALLRREEHDMLLAAIPHPHAPSAGPIPGFLAFGSPSLPTGFAGPEREAVMLLVQHWSSALDAALMHEREKHRAQVQAALYLATLHTPRPTRDEVIENCLHALAQATGASVAFWQYQEGVFVRKRSVGSHLWKEDRLLAGQHQMWPAWFSTADDGASGTERAARPSYLPRTDGWLPLTISEHLFGAITLLFPSKYVCDQKEQQILQAYVLHCAQALFSSQEREARLHLRLQAEQLQVLKDQFLTRASRQLLIPLTALRGYIELLEAGNVVHRAEYIDKAFAVSVNLGDLVDTLLRLSSLSLDEEDFSLKPVVLSHCLQTAGTSIGKAEHPGTLLFDIPSDLCVTGDEQALVMALTLLLTAAREEHEAPVIESRVRRMGNTVELLVEVQGKAVASPLPGDETRVAACAYLIEAMGGSFQRTAKTTVHSSFTLAFTAASQQYQDQPAAATRLASFLS